MGSRGSGSPSVERGSNGRDEGYREIAVANIVSEIGRFVWAEGVIMGVRVTEGLLDGARVKRPTPSEDVRGLTMREITKTESGIKWVG